MIKVTVFYPNLEGKTFDMDYYCNTHIPMVKERLGDACKGISVDQGLSGGESGTTATYASMAHMLFDSVEEFQSSFGPHTQEIMEDIPNFTDIEPSIQISEIKV